MRHDEILIGEYYRCTVSGARRVVKVLCKSPWNDHKFMVRNEITNREICKNARQLTPLSKELARQLIALDVQYAAKCRRPLED